MMRKENYNNKGGITIEASLLVPIVAVVVCIIFYMLLIQIQLSIMYMTSVYMSKKMCANVVFPGFEEIHENAVSDLDGNLALLLPYRFTPSKDTITNIYDNKDPYRYVGGVYLKDYRDYEKELNDILSKQTLLLGGNMYTAISAELENLATLVRVIAIYEFELPKFVNVIGMKHNMTIETEVVAYASDSAEFVRNADLAFDTVDFLLEKYSLKDKIDTYYEKLKDLFKTK